MFLCTEITDASIPFCSASASTQACVRVFECTCVDEHWTFASIVPEVFLHSHSSVSVAFGIYFGPVLSVVVFETQAQLSLIQFFSLSYHYYYW